MNSKNDVIKSFIETGADISGAVAGAVLGGLVAGPAGIVIGGASGPLITRALKTVGLEIKNRLLGEREEVRIGATYAFALQRIQELEESGKNIRDDDFFTDNSKGRTDAEEIFEGVILSSQKEYEERKVKFIGNLYANICTNTKISREHANRLIRTTNDLSFRQFCILQLLKEKKEERDIFPEMRKLGNYIITEGDAIIEIRDLQQKGLLKITARWNDIDDNSAPIKYKDISISDIGEQYCAMLSLEQLEKTDLDDTNKYIKIKVA